LEIYSQLVGTNSFGAEAVLLGLLALLVGVCHQSETFERLVGSRIREPLYLAYGTYGLPLMLLLMEVQKRRRPGGGISRIFGGLVLLVILVIVVIGAIALLAFFIYRYSRRRRR
jgi:hypothetical protein